MKLDMNDDKVSENNDYDEEVRKHFFRAKEKYPKYKYMIVIDGRNCDNFISPCEGDEDVYFCYAKNRKDLRYKFKYINNLEFDVLEVYHLNLDFEKQIKLNPCLKISRKDDGFQEEIEELTVFTYYGIFLITAILGVAVFFVTIFIFWQYYIIAVILLMIFLIFLDKKKDWKMFKDFLNNTF